MPRRPCESRPEHSVNALLKAKQQNDMSPQQRDQMQWQGLTWFVGGPRPQETRPNRQLRNVSDIEQRTSHIDLGVQYVLNLKERIRTMYTKT